MKMPRSLAGLLVGLALASAPAPTPAADLPPAPAASPELATLKQLQQRVMASRLKVKLDRQRRLATLDRSGARPWLPSQATAGRRPKREPIPSFPGLDAADRAAAAAAGEPLPSLLALAPNVRLNNPANDVDPTTTGQSEVSIAAHGNNVLAAWNDGDGFNRLAPNDDVMGYAYSTNGGASFTDGGTPPKRTNWTYVSDPVISVNEKTGEFYFSSLIDSLGFNGVAVVRATFSGGGVVWGTPIAARMVNSAFSVLDKQWVVADSASGYVYVIYTNFNSTTGTQTDFNRSPNGTNWVAFQKLNTTGDNFVTPGARVITGPAGELYAIWPKIGPLTGDGSDFFIVRKSTNNGSAWGAEITLPSYFSNFSSGAPGFNRERGITTPAVAVDRTFGPNRGRVYVAWNECVNYFDDPVAGAGNRSEAEATNASGANDIPASATAATVGNTLRGSLGNAADIDYFALPLTQGQTYLFYCDSTDGSLDLSYRLICSDGVTRLAISNFGAGSGGLIIFTAPSTATYYLRILDFFGAPGPYRVRTNTVTNGPNNRARDHRDLFVTSSASGTTWSTPTRVNQSAIGFDDWMPEVVVDARVGKPEVVWYDWRDTPPANCGGYSHVYFAFSNDAGTTWNEAGLVTDAQTNWTTTQSNIAPNQGDYLGFYADSVYAYVAWGDGRSGNVDAYAAAVPLVPTPVLVSFVSAQVQTGAVTLTWFASGSEGGLASVQRRAAGDGWRTVGEAAVDGSGRVVFTDRAVAPGARYDYRIGLSDGGLVRFLGETSVLVPFRAVLALAPAGANPSDGPLRIRFTLPAAGTARLALFDIGGRAVTTREVGSYGPGTHVVELAAARALPAGVYLATLEQDGRRVAVRLTVLD